MDNFNSKLESILEIKINDIDLYRIAFTHRSYLNENKGYRFQSNERLEFLGDAILQFLSSEYLYKKYPYFPEGKLTNIRAAVVCTESLALASKNLGYGEFLLLSKGEESTGGRDREYILANTFEAVLGAIYMDNDIHCCRKFLEHSLFTAVKEVVDNNLFKDAKSTFQELAQELKGITPNYRDIEDWGPDHDKTFKVGVYLDDKFYGEGLGGSKQDAQQEAAKRALEIWGKI